MPVALGALAVNVVGPKGQMKPAGFVARKGLNIQREE